VCACRAERAWHSLRHWQPEHSPVDTLADGVPLSADVRRSDPTSRLVDSGMSRLSCPLPSLPPVAVALTVQSLNHPHVPATTRTQRSFMAVFVSAFQPGWPLASGRFTQSTGGLSPGPSQPLCCTPGGVRAYCTAYNTVQYRFRI
jgi:hypothetical protein